jgi:hypothetical protein
MADQPTHHFIAVLSAISLGLLISLFWARYYYRLWPTVRKRLLYFVMLIISLPLYALTFVPSAKVADFLIQLFGLQRWWSLLYVWSSSLISSLLTALSLICCTWLIGKMISSALQKRNFDCKPHTAL